MARAFETSERARGRALADLLAEAQARLTDPAVAKVRAQEAEFGKRLSALQTAIIDAKSDADRRARVADLERAERDYDAMVVRIRRETPRYAALAHPRATTAAEIAKTLAPDEALVSFWIGDARGAAFVVTRTQLSSYPLPGRRDIDRDVARLKSAITGGQIDEVRRLGAALYKTLLQGAGTLGPSDPRTLGPIRRLILVPDGPLWRVPFAALTVDAARGEWLIGRTAISLMPSASLLHILSAPPAAKPSGSNRCRRGCARCVCSTTIDCFRIGRCGTPQRKRRRSRSCPRPMPARRSS
jgi:CHAT domain-containing protein